MNKWLFTLIQVIIANASPEIIQGIRSAILDWHRKAKETPNPWDDILPGLLLMLVGGAED